MERSPSRKDARIGRPFCARDSTHGAESRARCPGRRAVDLPRTESAMWDSRTTGRWAQQIAPRMQRNSGAGLGTTAQKRCP